MTIVSFTNGHVVGPHGVVSDASFSIEGGVIVAVAEGAQADAVDLDGGWIMPGFIDTQVNGGGGVLFNDAPTVDGVAAIGAAHRRFGTTAFLPTLISDMPDVIARALDGVDQAIAAQIPGVVGIHVEGPVLNPAHMGIHDSGRFRALDDTIMTLLLQPRRGKVMVTLAPELVPADRLAALVRAGILVSIGHSNASYAEATAGFGTGITGVTHLFNAMSPLRHRAPGVVGAALDARQPYCGLIVDGFHVDDAALRIALRARPVDRMMLVTDAMPCVGTDATTFLLQGRPIAVENGRCLGADGTLAGSDLDMARAVRNTVERLGIAPEEAAAMASTNPAAFLGLSRERGTLAPGRRADWVQLDAGFAPVATTIAGTAINAATPAAA